MGKGEGEGVEGLLELHQGGGMALALARVHTGTRACVHLARAAEGEWSSKATCYASLLVWAEQELEERS